MDSRTLVDAFLAEDRPYAARLLESQKVPQVMPAVRLSPDAERRLLDDARERAQTKMVLDLTRRLAEQGHAALFVSHNMNDVFEVADRIIVLYLGRVVALRPAGELDRQIAVDLMTSGASDRLDKRLTEEREEDA